MNRSLILTGVILLALLTLNVGRSGAETIYSWTDDQGIRRYSNQAPPENARDVKILESVESSEGTTTSSAPDRRFDEFVERVRNESRELERERQASEAARAAEKQRRRQTQQEARIDAERRKLQAEIDAIKARGLSRTFSQGMKDSLIQKVQKRMDLLEKDPEVYFRDHQADQ